MIRKRVFCKYVDEDSEVEFSINLGSRNIINFHNLQKGEKYGSVLCDSDCVLCRGNYNKSAVDEVTSSSAICTYLIHSKEYGVEYIEHPLSMDFEIQEIVRKQELSPKGTYILKTSDDEARKLSIVEFIKSCRIQLFECKSNDFNLSEFEILKYNKEILKYHKTKKELIYKNLGLTRG